MLSKSVRKKWATLLAGAIFVVGLVIYVARTGMREMPITLNVPGSHDTATTFQNWDKIHLTITGPNEVEQGKPIDVEVTLHNGDASWDLVVHGGNTLRPLGLSLYGPHFQLPRSKLGNELLRPTTLGYTLDGPIVATGPSESRTWKVDLAQCFDLPPATYHLIAAVDVSAHDSVNQKEFSAALSRGAMIDGKELVSDAWTFVVK